MTHAHQPVISGGNQHDMPLVAFGPDSTDRNGSGPNVQTPHCCELARLHVVALAHYVGDWYLDPVQPSHSDSAEKWAAYGEALAVSARKNEARRADDKLARDYVRKWADAIRAELAAVGVKDGPTT